MSTKATATKKETKKEFTLKEIFAMWRNKSKDGKHTYFSGKLADGTKIVGFYNGKKNNPKEPDIRIHKIDSEGKTEKEAFLSLWCNTTTNGKKYLSGKLDGKRVVGFITSKATEESKLPYFRLYWSDDQEKKTEEAPKKETFEEVETEDDLPF